MHRLFRMLKSCHLARPTVGQPPIGQPPLKQFKPEKTRNVVSPLGWLAPHVIGFFRPNVLCTVSSMATAAAMATGRFPTGPRAGVSRSHTVNVADTVCTMDMQLLQVTVFTCCRVCGSVTTVEVSIEFGENEKHKIEIHLPPASSIWELDLVRSATEGNVSESLILVLSYHVCSRLFSPNPRCS